MPKYVKRPVEIEALQWTGDNKHDILQFCHRCFMQYDATVLNPNLKVNTLEGIMEASKGDYIIRGIKGEFYPCKEDVFELTYDKVKD